MILRLTARALGELLRKRTRASWQRFTCSLLGHVPRGADGWRRCRYCSTRVLGRWW